MLFFYSILHNPLLLLYYTYEFIRFDYIGETNDDIVF